MLFDFITYVAISCLGNKQPNTEKLATFLLFLRTERLKHNFKVCTVVYFATIHDLSPTFSSIGKRDLNSNEQCCEK